jgi:hypothetical protein
MFYGVESTERRRGRIPSSCSIQYPVQLPWRSVSLPGDQPLLLRLSQTAERLFHSRPPNGLCFTCSWLWMILLVERAERVGDRVCSVRDRREEAGPFRLAY